MAASDKLPKAGRVYRYKSLLFWAQGGIICIVDEAQDGDFHTETAADFAARVILMGRSLKLHQHVYADEREADTNFVLNGAACVKEARKQGDPFDPAALAQMLRSRSRSFIYTGDGCARVVEDPVVKQSGGIAQEFQFSPGSGSSITLHTVSQDQAPEQKSELPPIPTKGDKSR